VPTIPGDDVLAEVVGGLALGVARGLEDQHAGLEDVDAHRRQAPPGLAGDLRRVLDLLVEGDDAHVLVDLGDAEVHGLLALDLHAGHGEVRVLLHVQPEHQRVVHLVDVIAADDQHVLGALALQGVDVLVDGVGGAQVPVGPPGALLRRGGAHVLAELGVEDAPAALDVLDERTRLVLHQHVHAPESRVQTVGQREVDDAVGTAEGHRGLGAVAGQGIEALALAAGQQHDDGVTDRVLSATPLHLPPPVRLAV
jgi:hypothetical protein